MKPIIKVQKIEKSFGKKKILKGITLDVFEGEVLGVIGSSGSGKTTFLKTLAGFLIPDSGSVLLRQDLIKSSSIYNKEGFSRRVFGFASQQPSFYENLTVKENLEYFGSLYGSKNIDKDLLMRLLDLKHAEKTLGGKLSGGMERRLDIACAMIHNPKVLILDEPTADLDPVLRNHIWHIVQKICSRGTTIILASHHLSEVENICSRIAIIKEGVVVEVETPKHLKMKYADSQEVIIQTFPGDYEKIAAALKKNLAVKDMGIRSNELIIYSRQPNQLIPDLTKILSELDESLLDIKIFKPNLDDIFIKMSK